MNRLHLMIVLLFSVALVTGVLLGMSMSHNTTVATPGVGGGPGDHGPGQHGNPGGNRGSWLVDQLKLSPAQAEQVRGIWSDVVKTTSNGDQRDQYRKEREGAIAALLSPEQKAAYDKIGEHFKQEMTDLDKQNEAANNAATEKTKLVLNDEQRKQYEEMLKRGGNHGGPRGRGGPQGTRPDGMHGPGPGGTGGPDGNFDGPHGHDGEPAAK